MLAEALLSRLGRKQASALDDAWAQIRGLHPDSEAARELVSLALDLDEHHPRGLIAEDRDEILRRFAGNDEGLEQWAAERRSARYRAAGALLGRWLEARKREGYPPELLIERLLSRDAAAVARISAKEADERPARSRDFVPEAEAFEEGLQEAMASVPTRFRTGATAEP